MEIRPLVSQTPITGVSPRGTSDVRSPYTPLTVNDGYAGSIEAPSAVASAPTRPEMSSARRIILSGLAAITLTGGILSGIIASHASMHPPVAQETQRVMSPQEQRAEVTHLIDGMIEAGRNGREIPDSLRKMVHSHLDALPLDVVKTVAGNGAKIAIMKEGETPEDIGVIKNVDLKQFADTAGLRGLSDRAFANADSARGARVADLQARLEAAQKSAREHYAEHPEDIPRPQGLSAVFGAMQSMGDPSYLDPAVQKLSGELARARMDRLALAWEQLSDDSQGRLEPFGATVTGFDMNISGILRTMPTTVESIAYQHGARTPEEIKSFSDLMIAANGPRLLQAQQDFHEHVPRPLAGGGGMMGGGGMLGSLGGGTTGGKIHPPTPAGHATSVPMGGLMGTMGGPPTAYKDLKVSQRMFVAGDSDIVVPSYYFLRTTDNSTEKPRIVSGHDYLSMNNWKAEKTAGQYWFQDDRKTMVYHERYLKEDTLPMSTTVHEFGHAYEAALQARDPRFYATFIPRWDVAYQTDGEGKEGHRFPSGYAGTNRGEFFAEEFSAHFGPKQAELEGRDPSAAALMREALGDAPHVAHWNIAKR